MSRATRTGDSSPAMFDPNASAFVPPATAKSNGTASRRPNLTLQGTVSDVNSVDRKPLRSALPLYTSETWSLGAIQQAKSAGLPPKSSWDGLNNVAAPRRPAIAIANATATPNSPLASPLPGLGLTNGNRSLYGDSSRVIAAPAPVSASGVRYTQTEDYHNANNQGSFAWPYGVLKTTQSDPLPQHAFSLSNNNTAGFSSDTNSSTNSAVSPYGTRNGNQQQTLGDQRSSVSSASKPVTKQSSLQLSDRSDTKAVVWAERPHLRKLRRALSDPKAEWEEAFEGALTILAAVNPEHFQMPYGSRVVNIKTDFPQNVILSVRLGKYSVIDKVSERIMKVFESREDPSEKVLLLFSISGTKKFCGLAEMSGPWDINAHIDGWEQNSGPNLCVGSFPVTWIYVKDVYYHHFSHIRQPHNDHPVGNMWTGMNFSGDTGRQVMHQFVTTPAFSSILGHPKSYVENAELVPYLNSDGTAYQRRVGHGSRGGRGGRGGYRGGSEFNIPWREQDASGGNFGLPGAVMEDNDVTPTATNAGGRLSAKTAMAPKYSVPMLGNAVLAPGQIASVTVDAHGKSVLVPTSGHGGQSQTSSAASKGSTDQQYIAPNGGKSGLQHAASMSSIRPSAKGGPVHLPPINTSQSTKQLSHAHPASPYSSQTPTVGNGRMDHSHLTYTPASLTPRATTGAIGDLPYAVHQSPTHRPVSHAGRSISSSISESRSGLNRLKARYHQLQAEKYMLHHQAADSEQMNTSERLFNLKVARLTLEIREVEHELAEMGANGVQGLSPERRDSTHQFDQTSNSSTGGPNISPVRAADGRPLYSASTPGSPPTASKSKVAFGGGAFNRSDSPSSWGSAEKAVQDLVGSPKDVEKPPPAGFIQEFGFFGGASGSGNRGTSKAHSGAQADDKSQAGGVRLNP